MSPIVWLAAVALLACVVFTRSWLKGGRRRAAIAGALTLVVGFVAAVILTTFTSFDSYQSVAFVKVERVHRGSTRGIVPVFFGSGFVCDVSSMYRGSRYVLFLSPSAVGYQPSWYDWSIWRVAQGRVRTQRLDWGGEKSSSYDDFIAAIPSALQRPESQDGAAENGV